MKKITKPSFNPSDLRARFTASSHSANFHPHMTDGDSARVILQSNLSGAYDGYKGQEQALFDIQWLANAASFYAANAKGTVILQKDPDAVALLRQQMIDAICKQNGWDAAEDRETCEPDVDLMLKTLGLK